MIEPTILTIEGWMELMDEMSKPPADTPERRATFARIRARRALLDDMEFPDDEVVGSITVTSKRP
ncbi:hypothetical protein [Longimicrobium sp.]|jgi:hypothetical protein|uniref:hypothetical protein n=1 Tax=Longimicrobium sp. TaxID=2029185 RepID=UPI002EDAD07F